jgi:hypothetical protein
VLDFDAHGARDAMLGLLEEAHDMEAMRASLLQATAAQTRAAGIAAGAEDAGLPDLVALIDQERSAAADHRDRLRDQLLALHRHPSRVHALETFAAARATARVEQIRSCRLMRDIRDLLAASQLETATYTLLAKAAERAGHPDTARLAHQLRTRQHTSAERLSAELDPPSR